MQTIETLQEQKDKIEEKIQKLLLSGPLQELKKLRDRKTYLTRQMALIRFRMKHKKGNVSDFNKLIN